MWKGSGRDHGADVDASVFGADGILFFFGVVGGGKSGAKAETSDLFFEKRDQAIVGVGTGDDTFNADAILARGGKDAFHEDWDDFVL